MSGPSRRAAIKAMVGLGLASRLADCAPARQASPLNTPSALPPDPEPAEGATERTFEEREHPSAGDSFVFALGDREGQVVTPEDVPFGGPQVFVYPADASGTHIDNDSRLDQVILLRVDPSTLTEETAARSAEGIVAYSGICTHTGCEVSDWDEDARRLVCPCHDSQFDPSDNATVVEGPAPRRLAAVPVEIVEGQLRAAGGFVGRVGVRRR